ncbi:PIN domain-containing protein [Methanothrix soehngenii]|uniref:PIN domain-containing protein n=1 Tax=Methanothrix soehngenii TaxID=2223 RepID=UPI00300CDF68
MSYLLDSSALLAYYFGEAGGERVRELLSNEHTVVGISVLTMAEFWSRLHAEGWANEFPAEWEAVSKLLSEVHPVSLAVVAKSLELRTAATGRLPHVDALIAATAVAVGATLVHRDPHFAAIPEELLKQESLPDKSPPG